MTGRDDCLDELRTLTDRAERDDLAVAQDLVLRFALSHEGRDRRGAALDDLLATLARETGAPSRTDAQRAFHAALLAMIVRTGAAVGPEDGPV